MAKKKDSVVECIRRFNAGRDPERLALKYAAMRKSAFAFLRGTCHLFYEDLPKSPLLKNAPAVWACGDLHLENFGSYKGDDRLVYFDLNDFDEALLAPCTWDLLRLLTSILVAGKTLRITPPQALTLCRHFLDAYVGAIQDGKARWIERDTAQGLIKELLDKLQRRKRKAFLDARTVKKVGRRKIRIDGKHALAASAAQKRRVRAFMIHFSRTQPNPNFFRVLDVARRIAGTGSLGVERYVLLVAGKGSPDKNYLLDLKQALPSALSSRVKVKQSRWDNEAQRIVTIQRRVQAISMAFLHPVVFKATPYVLRGMQPSEDRVSLDGRNRRFAELGQLMNALGNLVAWGELRSSARQGSATVDALGSFWEKQNRRKKLINLARGCAARTHAQWEEYCRAFDKGIADRADSESPPAR
jgi:uncharacterized protein (DUF2252 family)